MELLWQPEIARVYVQLLSSSANVVTVEAALGSLQNLTACTWQVQVCAAASSLGCQHNAVLICG